MAFIKFISDIWLKKIVPALSKVHGARWPGFDGEDNVVQTSVHHSGCVVLYEASILQKGQF